MIKPRIESIGTQFGEPLDTIDFADMENFHTVVRVMIGPSEGPGEESFDFRVCSPRWFEDECEQRGHLFTSRQLVVTHWDNQIVEAAIRDKIATLTGETWSELAKKLAAISDWEFENYRNS